MTWFNWFWYTEYSKMNPYYKEKWLKELRSGKFTQGHGTLCSMPTDGPDRGTVKDGEWCCLGVLYYAVNRNGPNMVNRYSGRKEAKGTLPTRLTEKVELEESASNELIDMNDHKKANFAAIADWIEENL